jgi:putative transposase
VQTQSDCGGRNARCLTKSKGSRSRAKARIAVAKVHDRIGNLRSNFAHQLTPLLVKKYPALCLENLSIAGLAKTKLAKSMLDVAFGETVRQWKYKIALEQRSCPPSR